MKKQSALALYLSTAFRWQSGRQGSGYDKMLILGTLWPFPVDCYLIRYTDGVGVPPHTDPVKPSQRHFRLNLILKAPQQGGEFVCSNPIFSSSRIKLFRPDLSEHSVTPVKGGSRYVLSIGWVLKTKR